jgi:hypothetical protein
LNIHQSESLVQFVAQARESGDRFRHQR